MPLPILLLKRETQLRRPVTASDFTGPERLQLRRSLTSCIQAADEAGNDANANRLREVWRRCIAVDDPPRFAEDPDVSAWQRFIESCIDLDVRDIELAPEAAATGTSAYLLAHGLTLEDADRCPHCGEEDAPGTPAGGSWWWPHEQGLRCRHCRHLWRPIHS